MSTKYKTIVFDSIGEMARLYFTNTIKKHAGDMDSLREVYHYMPTTERLNIFVRRLTTMYRRFGTEIVIIGHEQIDKIYAKGGAIAPKGTLPQEPAAVRGMPDLPGQAFPEELLRKCDIILRMRAVNQKPTWIGIEEPLSPTVPDAPWYAGGRFDLKAIRGGYLPADWREIDKLARELKIPNYSPPYIWMIYGRSKIGKTRHVIHTFPKPMRVFDFDRGSHVIGPPEKLAELQVTVSQYNTEEMDDYSTFLSDFEACFS